MAPIVTAPSKNVGVLYAPKCGDARLTQGLFNVTRTILQR